MEFEIISGYRKNSEMLYIPEQKMIYVKKSVYQGVYKYECRQKTCKARVNLVPNGKCILPKKYVEHNHGNEEVAYRELKALNKIKSECHDTARALGGIKSNISVIKSAFRRTCETHQDDTKNLFFPKLQRGLQKIVSKNLVTSPTTITDIINAFNTENVWEGFGLSKDNTKPRHFFTTAIHEENYSFCLFSSLKTIDLIKENISPTKRTYLIDATFKIVPHGCFKQLLVVYIQYCDEIFPIFFVVMDKKTNEIYKALFQYIKENIFDLDPNIFITDYEQGLRNSLSTIFPRARLVGCWFHFCQAVRRNMTKQKSLLEFLRASKYASSLYHKMLALPLLPPNLINSSFAELKSKIFLMDTNAIFSTFLIYFENQWINKIGCQNFAVHNQDTRTTAAVEAYNGFLGRSAEKNGHFFKFVRIIRDEEFFKSRHFETMCDSGGSLAKKKRGSSVEKSARIKEATHLLKEGKITASAFLTRMVFGENKICINMVPEDNIFKEDLTEDEESAESMYEPPFYSTENECIVCQDKKANIVLIPCKHLKICNECDLKLQADALSKKKENYKCPYCREVVQSSMQVYV